jgi:hypothetical protein
MRRCAERLEPVVRRRFEPDGHPSLIVASRTRKSRFSMPQRPRKTPTAIPSKLGDALQAPCPRQHGHRGERQQRRKWVTPPLSRTRGSGICPNASAKLPGDMVRFSTAFRRRIHPPSQYHRLHWIRELNDPGVSRPLLDSVGRQAYVGVLCPCPVPGRSTQRERKGRAGWKPAEEVLGLRPQVFNPV